MGYSISLYRSLATYLVVGYVPYFTPKIAAFIKFWLEILVRPSARNATNSDPTVISHHHIPQVPPISKILRYRHKHICIKI